MNSQLKEYTEPRMEVIEIKYQNMLLMVSGIIDENDPIGPAKSREYDDDMQKLLEENFLL